MVGETWFWRWFWVDGSKISLGNWDFDENYQADILFRTVILPSLGLFRPKEYCCFRFYMNLVLCKLHFIVHNSLWLNHATNWILSVRIHKQFASAVKASCVAPSCAIQMENMLSREGKELVTCHCNCSLFHNPYGLEKQQEHCTPQIKNHCSTHALCL
jgi:hypothetical protein